ncbi:MAG: hypothetical protein H7098_12315 [Oligoflexus sp.]|nr:hypothetical protein [Pseudopedobacter sp.]
MKKSILLYFLVFISSATMSQQTNFNQFNMGISYGIPYDKETRVLNGNLLKLSLQQDFRLGNLISLSALGDYNHSNGKNIYPSINTYGLGGGIKIQMVPVFQFINTKILKRDSLNYKFNIFIQSNATLNINKSQYFETGTLYDHTIQTGIELFDRKKGIYKIFYSISSLYNDGKYLYVTIPSNAKIEDRVRTFGELGIAVGFKNFSKKKK